MITHKKHKTLGLLFNPSWLDDHRRHQTHGNNQTPSQMPTSKATFNMPKTLCNIAFITLILIIAKASNTTATLMNMDSVLAPISTQAKTTTTTAWPFKSINRRIDNLSVDKGVQALYVLSGDDVLKYQSDFTLLQTIAGNRSISSSGSSQDRPTSIIFTTITHNELSLLLSCSAGPLTGPKTLACQLYRIELQRGLPIGWTSRSDDGQSIKLNIETGPGEQMHILSGNTGRGDMLLTMSRPTPPNDHPLKIMNSTSLIDNQQGLHMPTMARFNLVTKGSKSLQISAVLPYKSEVDRTNDYVYMFRSNDHTHFVLNEISGTQSSVRLARVCNDDVELYSYAEISITCGGKTNIVAKTATLINTTSSDLDLYVALEDANSTSTTSYICKYSLKMINTRFDAAIRQCHRASHLAKSLAKFYLDSSSHDCKLDTLSSDWCSSKINTYIDGTSEYFAATEDKFVEIKGISSVNFVHVYGQGDKTLYFIGTKTGLFSKFNPVQDDVLYTVDLFSKKIRYPLSVEPSSSSSSFEPLESTREARYAIVSDDVIAATSANELHRLPMDSCRFYRTCSVCMRISEPDLCVWCDGMCSRERECTNATQIYKSHCPPHIERFEPFTGPISGHTRLTIYGQSFGSSKASRQIKLGDLECLVDKRYSSDSKIICELEPVDKPRNATLQVTVTDKTGAPDIEGTAEFKDVPYEYMEVAVYGLYPNQGPLSGNNVTIYGKNLAVGARRDIHFGEIECKITAISNDKIVCRTEIVQEQQDDSIKDELPPVLKIDGQIQEFSYKPLIDGYALSKTYLFVEDSAMPAEVYTQAPVSLTLIVFIIALIVVAFTVVIIFRNCDGLTVLKKKLPGALSSRSPDVENAKVMFRNPHSHTFNNSDSSEMRQSDSLNGLIKLKGSVMSGDYFGKPEQLEQDKPLMQNFLDEEMLALLAKENILIDRNKLTLGHVLGSGQFGRVYKGFLKVEQTGEHAAVAVKTLHSRCHWEDGTDNQAFLEEGLMMKDFNHENVLALIGVAFDSNGLPMVITPYMLYGDLRSYISDEASSPSVRELIEFGIQVAKGMAYLSNQKFVHRDLAARNCMLDENLVVKVADFGLSRDIYERDYYSSDNKTVKLPVKWMAIESLEKSVYTTKSDVWSYGVLLWELMTRGVVPYPDVDNFDLYQYLKAGRRMYRPKYCPVIFYDLMRACWNENPALRPTFDELVVLVSDVITKLLEANDESGQQKVDKDETYCDVIR